jgi:hypothetical protein
MCLLRKLHVDFPVIGGEVLRVGDLGSVNKRGNCYMLCMSTDHEMRKDCGGMDTAGAYPER